MDAATTSTGMPKNRPGIAIRRDEEITRQSEPSKPPTAPTDVPSVPTIGQEDFWTDTNSFLNEAENGERTGPHFLVLLRPFSQCVPVTDSPFWCLGTPLVPAPSDPASGTAPNAHDKDFFIDFSNFLDGVGGKTLAPRSEGFPLPLLQSFGADAVVPIWQDLDRLDAPHLAYTPQSLLAERDPAGHSLTGSPADYRLRPVKLNPEPSSGLSPVLPNAPRIAVSRKPRTPQLD